MLEISLVDESLVLDQLYVKFKLLGNFARTSSFFLTAELTGTAEWARCSSHCFKRA